MCWAGDDSDLRPVPPPGADNAGNPESGRGSRCQEDDTFDVGPSLMMMGSSARLLAISLASWNCFLVRGISGHHVWHGRVLFWRCMSMGGVAQWAWRNEIRWLFHCLDRHLDGCGSPFFIGGFGRRTEGINEAARWSSALMRLSLGSVRF
jgi:hypothetical protein